MSNDPIVSAVNNNPQYITALADFFSKHRHTLGQFVEDFEAGLNSMPQADKEGQEA